MKQISNKAWNEWQQYLKEKSSGRILSPETLRFICEANGYDPERIGRHMLEVLRKVYPGWDERTVWEVKPAQEVVFEPEPNGTEQAGFPDQPPTHALEKSR